MPRILLRTGAAVLLFLSFLVQAPPASASAAPDPDGALREGYTLLTNEQYDEARRVFSRISPDGYDLGDYLLYFTGFSLARQGKREEAASVLETLSGSFPESPLPPYLSHELAYAAAKADDLAAARKHFSASRGKVSGNGRKAEEGYIAARLLEREIPAGEGIATPPPPVPENGNGTEPEALPLPEEPESPGPSSSSGRFRPTPEAARAHLENFVVHTVQEGAALSMERLWKWRTDGIRPFRALGGGYIGKFANALFRAGETSKARSVYQEALAADPSPEEYHAILLDYAEFLRKQGDTTKAKTLLAGAVDGAPPAFRAEVEFLSARVDWKAGRVEEARRKFLQIPESGASAAVAERSRNQAAWISLELGDLPGATEEFGKLAGAKDEQIRQEAIFRQAFGLYLQKNYPGAAAAFEAGEKSGVSSVERARHAYWRGRILHEMGEEERGKGLLESIASDPGAGPFALFAAKRLGRDSFAMLSAPSSGETRRCEQEKEELWEKIRGAGWSNADGPKVRRAARLTRLGMVEYAVLEAERVDRGEVRRVLGLAGGYTPALFRYLAGDLRGAIRETLGLAADRGSVGLADRLQYPLAPQFVGDCDGKKAGVDPLVLHAIIRQESLFQYNALSPAGAVGLMQLMPRTARRVAPAAGIRGKLRRSDLLRPERNVALGAATLSILLKEYGGDYLRAVAAYNAGEAAVARWWEGAEGDPALFLERVTYRETRGYLRKVFFNLLQYYRIYRPEMFARYFPTAPKEGTPAPGASGTPPGEGTPGAVPAPEPSPESPAADPSGG